MRESGQPSHPSPARRGALGVALLLSVAWFAASGRAGPALVPFPPPFVIRPNPPSAGQDVDVTYTGDNPQDIVYRVGDGEWEAADVGSDGKFKIPKARLAAGKNLYIKDTADPDGKVRLCVLIEP